MEDKTDFVGSFNEEVVWDNNRTLFDTYFKESISSKRHYVCYIETDKKDFIGAVAAIKFTYKTL